MAKFLGMNMTQSWNDLPIWEEFFNKYPLKTFIELGTGEGGMSTFLALQCFQRNIHFYTFDHQRWFDFSRGVPPLLNLASRYQYFDIFSEGGTNAVADIIRNFPKPLGIFFDNGNKPREWKLFAPLTSPGDFCAVHDWGVEFKQEDIGDVSVARILAELCDARPPEYKAMWFQRT